MKYLLCIKNITFGVNYDYEGRYTLKKGTIFKNFIDLGDTYNITDVPDYWRGLNFKKAYFVEVDSKIQENICKVLYG